MPKAPPPRTAYHFLEAADGALGGVDELGLPALTFGVAQIHAHEVLGKERGLVAAGAGADLEDGVTVVIGIVG